MYRTLQLGYRARLATLKRPVSTPPRYKPAHPTPPPAPHQPAPPKVDDIIKDAIVAQSLESSGHDMGILEWEFPSRIGFFKYAVKDRFMHYEEGWTLEEAYETVFDDEVESVAKYKEKLERLKEVTVAPWKLKRIESLEKRLEREKEELPRYHEHHRRNEEEIRKHMKTIRESLEALEKLGFEYKEN